MLSIRRWKKKQARDSFQKGKEKADSQDFQAAIGDYAMANALDSENPKYYGCLGEACCRTGDYSAAISSLETALELGLKEPGAYSVLGKAYLRTGDYPAAISSLETAIELDSENSFFHGGLGAAYLKSGDYPAAISSLETALELGLKEPGAYSVLGEAYLKSGDYPAAISSLETALELGLKEPSAYGDLGEAYFRSGDYLAAKSSLEAAIELDSEDPVNHGNLGAAYSKLGDHPAAISSFETVLELGLKEPGTYGDLGWGYSKLGDYPAAISSLEAAIELDSEDPVFHGGLGAAYLRSGDYPAAISSLETAIELDLENPGYHCNLGAAYLKSGENPAAIRSLETAIELDSENSFFHGGLGAAYLKSGDYPAAISSLETAIALDSEDPVFHSNLGEVHGKLGDYAAAISSLETAIELDSENPGHHAFLGLLYTCLRDFPSAFKHYEVAFKLEPLHVDTHFNIAVTYQCQNEEDKVLEHFDKCLRQPLKDRQLESLIHYEKARIFCGRQEYLLAKTESELALEYYQRPEESCSAVKHTVISPLMDFTSISSNLKDITDSAEKVRAWDSLMLLLCLQIKMEKYSQAIAACQELSPLTEDTLEGRIYKRLLQLVKIKALFYTERYEEVIQDSELLNDFVAVLHLRDKVQYLFCLAISCKKTGNEQDATTHARHFLQLGLEDFPQDCLQITNLRRAIICHQVLGDQQKSIEAFDRACERGPFCCFSTYERRYIYTLHTLKKTYQASRLLEEPEDLEQEGEGDCRKPFEFPVFKYRARTSDPAILRAYARIGPKIQTKVKYAAMFERMKSRFEGGTHEVRDEGQEGVKVFGLKKTREFSAQVKYLSGHKGECARIKLLGDSYGDVRFFAKPLSEIKDGKPIFYFTSKGYVRHSH